MRLSAFNVYLEKYPEADQTLVYNTFTGGFVALDDATMAVLKKADAGGELEADERELIDPEFFDESVGILVETRSAEERAYRDHMFAWRDSPKRLDVIVSTTLACNLDCTYCCQADVLNGKTMSAPMGAAVADWIAKRAREIGAEAIELGFIGGEPLLHPNRLRQIAEDVRDKVSESGIRVTFSIVTNGVFLTKKLVEELVPLGLVGAKVTLDGDEHTHALTRPSKKKNDDTYSTIFRNVVDASQLIGVYVNGNYTPDTLTGFIPLLKKLADAGYKKGSRVHFSPALQGLGAPPEAGLGGCNYTGTHAEYLAPYSDAIRRAGYAPVDDMMIGPCAFHRRHSMSIDPDGYIYKCPGFLGRPEWAVGTVMDGLGPRYERMAGMNPQRACGDCANRPLCAGGCVAAEWMNAGRMEGVNCEIGFFERQGPDLIKRKFLMATSDSVEEAMSRLPDPPAALMRSPGDVVQRRGEHVSLRVFAA